MIPLILKLRRASHKEIAKAQDIIVEELYKVFDKAVLHGGTAIWRCFKGNRFSEDVDVYLPSSSSLISDFFEKLAKRGFIDIKKKITEKSIFSAFRLERAQVRFEAVFKKIDGFLAEYEAVDGNLITVYTLKPEHLVREKVDAYLNRFKIRDLYDIFFLLRHVESKDSVRQHMQKLVKNDKKPVDEQDLKAVIIEGLVPNAEKLIDYIKRWA